VAGVAVAVGAAMAAERAMVRRVRARPDPAPGEPLGERPEPERRVTSFDGTELAVVEAGPGSDPASDPASARKGDRPTLLFTHGFSLDLTTWHFQWRFFSRRYRCVLYDHRGHGRSAPGRDGDYSIEALGRDLLAVLDATCPEGPVVLIGHSMGGMAILSLAAAHPEEFGDRVVGVVLANTAAGEFLKELLGGLAVRWAALVRRAVAGLGARPARVDRIRRLAAGHGADLAFLIAAATNFGPGAPPSLVEHVTRVSAATPAGVWTDLFPNVLELDLWHALEHIRVPALVLVGDVDRVTPPAHARAIAGALQDARLVVFEGAGHCAMLERPEAFDAEVAAFLDGLAAKASVREPA
jgi:pimeloyl-ACP methyl ester carboxylesterase